MIELEHIEKTYGTGSNKVPVLHDVNLTVEAGEYIAIMGPSGSGKSTLMNILGYLDVPTGGVYRFDGEDNARAGDARMARIRNEKIGFVFQSFHLMQRRRAWENVALPLMYGNVKRSERKRRAEEALKAVGLGDRMSFYPGQLSGGQCQRVAIARAICTRPKLLLADEPTGALDSKAGQQIMDIFDELHDQGMTIVMITHEHAVAERARKMLYIYDGWLREEAGA
ncbi:MAG: ABC transporter ATP-binding protein [Clostridia bacterium]|nr:ABC transporter ATP-binding protein [Clostridia bacterium]